MYIFVPQTPLWLCLWGQGESWHSHPISATHSILWPSICVTYTPNFKIASAVNDNKAIRSNLMFLALDLLLDLDVEDGVSTGDLGVPVKLYARGTQQLGTVETLGRRLAVLAVNHLTDITEWILRRALSSDHL